MIRSTNTDSLGLRRRGCERILVHSLKWSSAMERIVLEWNVRHTCGCRQSGVGVGVGVGVVRFCLLAFLGVKICVAIDFLCSKKGGQPGEDCYAQR